LRVTQIGNFSVIEYLYPPPKAKYMVVGIPDAGLVGVLSSTQLIKKLNMQEVSGIMSPELTPIVPIVNGIARYPIRVFHKDELVVVISEVAIPPSIVYDMAELLVELANRYGVGMIISMTALAIPNRLEVSKPKVYHIVNNQDLEKYIPQGLTEKFGEGYIVGPYAPLLITSSLHSIDNITLTVESFMEIPDPEAAYEAIGVFTSITGIKIDASDLLKEAEEVRLRMKSLMQETRNKMEQMQGTKRPITYV
jgi:uncharacterized protein